MAGECVSVDAPPEAMPLPYAWQPYSAAIVLRPETPEPTPPPPDRRHRWGMTSEQRDRRWFRCRACGKRRAVTLLLAQLEKKIKQARARLQADLTQERYGRESFKGAAG